MEIGISAQNIRSCARCFENLWFEECSFDGKCVNLQAELTKLCIFMTGPHLRYSSRHHRVRDSIHHHNASSELGVWRCDRFSHNLVTHLTVMTSTTYRDLYLYLYCAQPISGSYVYIVNSANFSDLYTTGPQEFIIRKEYPYYNNMI